MICGRLMLMSRSRRQVRAVICGVMLCLILPSCNTAEPVELAKVNPDAPQAELTQDRPSALREYKSWRLINPSPVKASPMPPGGAVVGVGCRDPFAPINDPHGNRYVSVYVNEAGERAMLAEKKPVFPPGSVIVMEHRDADSDPSPALLTAMVKHERGSAPNQSDWEFLFMDGSAGRIADPQMLSDCWVCHITSPQTDHVIRGYLPKDVANRLRQRARVGKQRTAPPNDAMQPAANGADFIRKACR